MKREISKFQQKLNELAEKRTKRRAEKMSAFQERLHKAMEDVETPEDGDDNNQSLLAQWININYEKPEYYTPVDIFDGIDIHEARARVSDGETEYYVNSKDASVIFGNEVIQWRKRPGIIYNKYDPMTAIDITPILSPNDVQLMIYGIKKMMRREVGIPYIPSTEYNDGLSDCITVLEETLNQKLGNVK